MTTTNPYETTSAAGAKRELPAAVAFRLPRLQRVFYLLAGLHMLGMILGLAGGARMGGAAMAALAVPSLVIALVYLGLSVLARAKPLLAVYIGIALFALYALAPLLVDPRTLFSGLFGKVLAAVVLIFGFKEAKALESALRG